MTEGPGLGSGRQGQQLDAVFCANAATCCHRASKVCQNCRLVAYCSRDCQKQHWALHKQLCKSHLMQSSWLPSWIHESRRPAFKSTGRKASVSCDLSPEIALSQPFQGEWLWGNVPAYGLLGSAVPCDAGQNEENNEMGLCFVACGDLRNVIETVCQIPDGFNGKTTVYVNDRNPKVMLRNFLMLELLRAHGMHAIDVVIALWYSIALTPPQLEAVRVLARQMQSWPHSEDGMYSYSSSFGSTMSECLVAQFSKNVMETLQLLYNNGMSLDAAKKMRISVVMSQPDLGERRMGCLHPAHRLAWHHFRQTGLLLPFGSQSSASYHDKTNQFLFTPLLGWTLGDSTDPLDGWDSKQIKRSGISYGVPVNDLYGCLFFHLRAKLQLFLEKWMLNRVQLILTNMSASKLARYLRRKGVKLHRVDTSNLADMHYMGTKDVLIDWAPLLHPHSNNLLEPIIITYFLNWALVYNIVKQCSGKCFMDPAVTQEEFKLAIERSVAWGRMKEGFAELVLRLSTCGEVGWYTYFHDFTKAFDEYLAMDITAEEAQAMGLRRKRNHSVVPHRLFVAVGAGSNATPPLDVEDFYEHTCISFNHTQTERFVEWTNI